VNRPRAKGTRRERKVLDMLLAAGLNARRAGNNLPAKDLEVDLPGMSFAIEVKDRQNLKLHAILNDVQANWPTQISAVVWHRTAKPDPESRARPVGPTIVAMPLDEWVKIIATLNWSLNMLRQPMEGNNEN
jgi:hypothetical protein